MAQDKTGFFRKIFFAMMVYTGLVWVCTVAFILAAPWDKGGAWKPEFRLAALCANGEACGVPYGQLAEMKAKGAVTALVPSADTGEIQEPDNWLRWKKVAGEPWQLEVTASSWHFQTTLRYRLEGDTPVLVQSQEVNGTTLYYGMGAAAFMLLGLYLRKLRR